MGDCLPGELFIVRQVKTHCLAPYKYSLLFSFTGLHFFQEQPALCPTHVVEVKDNLITCTDIWLYRGLSKLLALEGRDFFPMRKTDTPNILRLKAQVPPRILTE